MNYHSPSVRRCSAVLLLLLAVCAGPAGAAEELVLVKDGAARSVIVIDGDAAEEVVRGAEELQKHVEAVTGARLDIIRPEQIDAHKAPVRIHIGLNPAIKAMAPDLSRCEKDGAWIKALSDRDLLIAGKTPYGTEFGVYGFLQRYCGVRWYLPGPDGTRIPKRATLTVPRMDVLDNPSFVSRQYMAPSLHAAASAIFPCPDAVDMDKAWYRHNRLRRHFWCHHNLGKIIVPSKYGKEHPEYFPEVNGERRVPTSDWAAGFQPCMTNDDVIRLCAEAALQYFEENPDAVCFSLGMNDLGGYCECAKCRAANGGTERKNSRGLPDYARVYFGFANRVAAKLCETRKDRYVGVCAYARARDMPEGMTFHPNVIVMRVGAFVSYFCPMDRQDMERTRLMAEKCRTFGVYDYWYGSGYVIPLFCVGLMEEYIDFLAGLGARGWGAEIYQNWSMDGVKYYLLAQKLWTPSLRVKDLLGEFCRDMFDAGAPDMLAFYELCRDRWESQGFDTSKYHLQKTVQQLALFDVATCNRMRALLTAAREKTKNPKGRRLIDHSLTAFQFTAAHAKLLEDGLRTTDQKPCAENTLAALRALQEVDQLRIRMRQDAFSLPRSGKAPHIQGLFESPETIAAPLLSALDEAKDDAGKAAFMETVSGEMPELLPKIEWAAQHLQTMKQQPELLTNGSFEKLAANRCDAEGWGHGDWGSGRRCNGFVVPQGIDGTNCYYLVGVKNVFTYMPYPAICMAKPVGVEGGKWYLMQAHVRTHREGGLLTMPTFHVMFPGALPKSLQCSISPPANWFRAVWLFQAPDKAKTAIVRFLGGPAQGQTWVDGMSLKRVPDEMAPKVSQEKSLAVYPPLSPAKTLPPPLSVDFSKPLTKGKGIHVAKGARLRQEAPACLSDDSSYIVLQIPWTFRSIHDLEVSVTASGRDGSSLGVYAADFARTVDRGWRKLGLTCLLKSEPLEDAPKTFTFRCTCPDSPQKTWLYFYRLSKKGTLNLHRVDVVPVAKTP